MKLIHSIPLALATVCLTLTGCDKKPATGDTGKPAEPAAKPAAVVDEKTALANFKTEVENVGKWIEEKQKTAPADPAAGMAMMGEMVAKFKAIKTDGLPADLKGAWGEMSGALSEMADLFKGMPTAKTDKPEDAMKALGEIMPKMMAMQAKIEPLGKKLEELGKKYDLDLSKLGKGH